MPKRPNYPTPTDHIDMMIEQQKLMMAAAETIWHRSMQIASGKMTAIENASMWMEKPTAMITGMENATLAAVSGKAPIEIMRAAMAPMTAKASANARRLRR